MKLSLLINLKRSLRQIGIRSFLSVILAAIALPLGIASTQALPRSEIPAQIMAKNEDVNVSGEKGSYEARIIVNSSPKRVWQVLTNYSDLPRFIPDIVSSKIVETKGNQTILEEIYSSSYTFGLKIKIKVQVIESYLKSLDIKMLKAAYLNDFQGNWKIKNINPKKTMIIYTIKIDPKLPFAKELFYQSYEEQLLERMKLLKKEIESRSS